MKYIYMYSIKIVYRLRETVKDTNLEEIIGILVYVKTKKILLKILINSIISRIKLCIGATFKLIVSLIYILFNEGGRSVTKITYLRMFVCLFAILRPTREFHTFGDAIITRVGLLISTSTYTLNTWPLSDKGKYVACHTYLVLQHVTSV